MNNLFIVWNDSDCFGIPIIDEQHRALVSTINSLHYLLRNNHSKEALPAIINTIREYMKIHTFTEEEIMERTGYPDLSEHKKLHANLSAKSIVTSYKSLLLNDPMEVLDFLKNWWRIHIRQEDRLYISYVTKYMLQRKENLASNCS